MIVYSDDLAGQGIENTKRYFVPQSKIDLSLLATWLTTCEAHHGTACGEKKFAAAGVGGNGILLVDLKDICIVQSTLEARYCCLSYVWGNMDQLELTQEARVVFQQPGALDARMDQIPQTIRNTMKVVKGLGERYLWVDCLCIVQDDEAQRKTQLAQMAATYGSALLTVVAVASPDVNSPLPGVAHCTRRPDVLGSTGRLTFAIEPINSSA